MLSIWKYSPGLPFLAPSWLWVTCGKPLINACKLC
jgi:hypothetical protein